MDIESFVQSVVGAPGALSAEGIAFREKQVAEAEAVLREAKKNAASAEAKVVSIGKRQATVNARLAEVAAALKDKTGVRAVVADLKAVKAEVARRTPLVVEHAVLTEAHQLLVGEDLVDGELAAKEARLEIKRAQRDWCVCKAAEEAAKLWSAMAPAMKRDPNLAIQLDNGGILVEYAKKVAELETDVDEIGAALARETQVARSLRAGAHIDY
jgi:hypothetical protein